MLNILNKVNKLLNNFYNKINQLSTTFFWKNFHNYNCDYDLAGPPKPAVALVMIGSRIWLCVRYQKISP